MRRTQVLSQVSRTPIRVRISGVTDIQIPYLIVLIAVPLLLNHVQSMLELVQRCLADEDRSDSVVKLALGLVGDLADTFPNGEIKQLLLAEWLGQALKSKARLSADTKKTLRWAREVNVAALYIFIILLIVIL